MKAIKCIILIIISVVFIGCGSHGFEGDYSLDTGFTKTKVTIGADYTETNGERRKLDKIFKRESSGKKYLVFKMKEAEEAWEIVDNDTLVNDSNPMLTITMKKIK